MTTCHFQVNMPYLSQMRVFSGKSIKQVSCTFWPSFHCAKLQKILQVDPELWRHTIFQPKTACLPQMRIFSEKPLIYFQWNPWPISLFKISKKILRANPKLWGCTIFRPKMAHLPRKRIFLENSLIDLVAFIRVYVHAKNQTQMSIH